MASITTFFGTQGGGGSVSGTATRVAFFGGTPGSPSTTLDDSSNLQWNDTTNRLSIGGPNTVGSTLTIAAAGETDSSSAFEVRTSLLYGDKLLFRIFDNGRIDTRVLDSSGLPSSNIAIGVDAGKDITSGFQNVIIGSQAGDAVTSGSGNTLVGHGAGSALTNRLANTFIGQGAGALYNGVSANTVIGAGALSLATTGGQNIAIGLNAAKFSDGVGYPVANPTNCIYIGDSTISSSVTANNEIVIGNGVTGNGNNTVTIGDGNILATHLNGSIYLTEGNTIYTGGGTGTKIGGPSSKIAFYDETPILQPTTSGGSATVASPGAGNTIKTDDTFDGYTLAQVVRALRNIGILQ
jgi:hypothetical protein